MIEPSRKVVPHSGSAHPLNFILSRIVITIMLSILGCWTVYYCWPQRTVRYGSYAYSDKEAHRLRFYPKAQYAHGMRAWFQQQPEVAARFFRQAVSQNVLFLDAWLRLSEIELAMEHKKKAKEILTFTTNMTDKVFRWKWPQMLLARELDMQKRFYRDTNYLLSHKVLQQDALQLLHTHFEGRASAVVSVLDPAHLAVYLNWLMQWGMTDESLLVWSAMTEVLEPDKEVALRYSHFLLNHKRVTESIDIWQKYDGSGGLTNPGFEMDITRQGFDWRYYGEKDGRWGLKRDNYEAAEGDYALKITFNGQENIVFKHLFQIFPVNPEEKYRLTYAWKSTDLTTDQGLFVEIYSYDNQGLYQTSPMITGTHGWREDSITFEIPEGCHAAVLRLRRQPSKRFDSKIKGVLWIDDFRLQTISK
jgi:hypothetical protein